MGCNLVKYGLPSNVALLGDYAGAPQFLPGRIQIHLLYSFLQVCPPQSKIYQGLILHLRLGIYRCCLERVGLVPDSRSLLTQRDVGFPRGLNTVVRAGTAC